ncbi:MAG: NAD kinase [Ignavibacteria bacterium RBG_16_35_7]|nr:MAG: NAD kinase [Ignavibacteria bacterium RBG_16_35_7]
MKVAIYGRALSSHSSSEAFHTLFRKLEKAGVETLVYEPFLKQIGSKWKIKTKNVFTRHNEIKGKVKFLFSIGGDGTLLETVTLVRDSEIPVMGINTGRLGFLSSISKDEIETAVDAVLNGKYSLDKRILMELDVKGKLFGDCKFALNEIAVQKTDSSSMVTIHASVNGKFLNSYWADGLIVATPTGSTAYSLSCGGPIVMPDSDNFVITPVAPHNLNVRPIIISSHDVIELEVEGRIPNFLLSLDSRSENIQSFGKLKIRKANFLLSLVKLVRRTPHGENHDFLSTLRNKLMWGVDKRN